MAAGTRGYFRTPIFAITSAAIAVVVLLLILGFSGTTSADNAGKIDAGSLHTCAVTSDGAALCWGLNQTGQLGVGTAVGPEICTNQGSDEYQCSKVPLPVTGLDSGVTDISAGNDFTCAIQNGIVKCWGSNEYGQLGAVSSEMCDRGLFGIVPCSTTPQTVNGLTDVVGISAGFSRVCAVTGSGSAFCWGANPWGALGEGSETQRDTPTPVTGLDSGVKQIVSGPGGCALMDGGTVKCWGLNNDGELGIGNDTGPEDCSSSRKCSKTPVNVPGLTGVKELTAGDGYNCALLDEGSVKCWGQASNGQIGNGDSTGPDNCLEILGSPCAKSPTTVPGIAGATAISGGGAHVCVVADSGVTCWGRNSSGQLGTGNNTGPETCASGFKCSESPVDTLGIDFPVQAIAAGTNHTCVLTIHSGVECFGRAFEGQTGNDSETFYENAPVYAIGLEGGVTPSPTPVPQMIKWQDLDCSGTVAANDVLPILANAGEVDYPVTAGCFGIRADVRINNDFNADWGDVDCSGFVDFGDVYWILAGQSGIGLDYEDCFEPGEMVGVGAR